MNNVTEKALKILEQHVCDNCLGRQFGQLLSGYTNKERGAMLRFASAASIDFVDYKGGVDISNFTGHTFHNLELKERAKKKECSVCGNIFEGLEKYAEKIRKISKKYKFETFVVGTKLSSQLLMNEEALWERVGIDYCEPIKAEINRELGKLIEKSTGKKADTKKPEACFLIDLENRKASVELMPLFIYGRYQKLVRGIPQTKWPSGKYKTSVEQIIAKPFMLALQGKGHKLHGQGREDIDARCTAWRPFVLEILEPKKRDINIKKLAKKIAKQVRVKDLRCSDIAEVRRIKEEKSDKSYEVEVECERKIKKEELKKLLSLKGLIRQRTPQRVLHRRGDLERKKTVIEIKTKTINPGKFKLFVKCSAGLYVKELITGDDGRTLPNVTALLGTKCTPKNLDVTGIHEKK